MEPCKTCRFWVPVNEGYGQCRRRAPLDWYIAGLIAADRSEKAAGVSQPRRVGKCLD